MSILERLKSPVVLLGIGATILVATGVNPANLTSWPILLDNVVAFFSNPFMLFSTVVAVFAYLNNPTDKTQF